MPHLHRDREAIAGITLRDAARTPFFNFFLVSEYRAIFVGAFGCDVDATAGCVKGGLCLTHCSTGWKCKGKGVLFAVPAESGVEMSDVVRWVLDSITYVDEGKVFIPQTLKDHPLYFMNKPSVFL